MQRKDKEITSRDEIDAIIRRCRYCHVAFADEQGPYMVPVSFGYDGNSLYIHTAREGKKIDLLKKNRRICFAMEHDVRLVRGTRPCRWTFAFDSIVGFGRMEELTGPEQKASGLEHIVAHYAGEIHSREALPSADLRVFCIRIESVTGKRSHPPSADNSKETAGP